MKKEVFTLIKNVPIARDVFEMTLEGDASDIVKPGQFVNIAIDGLYLRRPISVCDWAKDRLVLIYKVVGRGTAALAHMDWGKRLDLLTGLGNGFDVSKSGGRPLLIAGGVGLPPMYGLAKRLVLEGKHPVASFGFQSAADAFYLDKFLTLGIDARVSTADGSLGMKGMVTDRMEYLGQYTYFYACGPEPMLHAVSDSTTTEGELSFEERMGCGFGACMGCSCKTKYGNKRICKDGPVLEKREVIW